MSSIDSILSKEGKDFVRNVAESVGYSQSKIADIFKNDKGYFFDYEQELCIRICESDNCNIVFDEGFLSDDCTVLRSEKCCHDSISDDIALPVIGGSIVGLLTTQNVKKDYQNFKQPVFAPSKEAFGIVWPILYTTMGIARTITKSSRKDTAENAYVYYTQLGLNYLWSLLYFRFKLRGTALIESFALFSSVLLTTVAFYKTNKVAGLLLIPYVVWTAYATYLNAGLVALNHDKDEYAVGYVNKRR